MVEQYNIRKLAAQFTKEAIEEIVAAVEKSNRTLPDNVINTMIREGSAKDLYRQAGRFNMKPDQLKKTLEYMSTKELIPAMEKTKYMGFIPGVKFTRNPVRSGYLERAAQELGSVIKSKSRNKKLMIGAGLTGALGYLAHRIFADSPEDDYKKKVDRIIKEMPSY